MESGLTLEDPPPIDRRSTCARSRAITRGSRMLHACAAENERDPVFFFLFSLRLAELLGRVILYTNENSNFAPVSGHSPERRSSEANPRKPLCNRACSAIHIFRASLLSLLDLFRPFRPFPNPVQIPPPFIIVLLLSSRDFFVFFLPRR